MRPPQEILERLRGRYGASGVLDPDFEGFARNGTVRLAYQTFGTAPRDLLLLPTWQILHSRMWKFQVSYLSRYFRVIAFDARGSGRSERPETGYDHDTHAIDALAVLDAVGSRRAALLAQGVGTNHAIMLAAEHPERVSALILIDGAPSQAAGPDREARRREVLALFHQRHERYSGWTKLNANYFREDYLGWLDFFIAQMISEPHSTKGIADAYGWGLDAGPEILVRTRDEWWSRTPFPKLMAQIQAPTLIVHGSQDRLAAHTTNAPFLKRTIPGAQLLTMDGCGHSSHLRNPAKINRLVRDFAGAAPEPQAWAHALTTKRRILWVCSPIGLGHVQRDLAIVRELRGLRPGLDVHWLAVDPVRSAVEHAGETIHPASARLLNESAHVEARAAEHGVNVFLALWEMDEILTANFMTFADVVEHERYDAWVGDEAWDVDHYLHENPELKTSPFVFLTDFIGMLPIAGWESYEGHSCWHANAEQVEHVARHPRIRDVAIFIGDPEDVPDEPFGRDLPNMRAWAREHFRFPGYVLPFDPETYRDTGGLRRRLGYRDDETLVFAAAGGTAVGRHLLERIADAYPALARDLRRLRLVVVGGPRNPVGDPRDRRAGEGGAPELRGYVPDLYQHLACCDLALVQGGLSTTMELVALRRPFISFPLHNHFEQRFHVAGRLRRHGHSAQMDYREITPDGLAAAIRTRLSAPTNYRPIEGGAARRAAELIAKVLG